MPRTAADKRLVERAVERSVKMAETASSELSAKLEIGESESQAVKQPSLGGSIFL